MTSVRADLRRHSRALQEAMHEVIFVIKERNLDELKRIFENVSNPYSLQYGKYWTSQQIADLTANLPARDAVVSYLASVGAEVVSETLHGELIVARGSVTLFEGMYVQHAVLQLSPYHGAEHAPSSSQHQLQLQQQQTQKRRV